MPDIVMKSVWHSERELPCPREWGIRMTGTITPKYQVSVIDPLILVSFPEIASLEPLDRSRSALNVCLIAIAACVTPKISVIASNSE